MKSSREVIEGIQEQGINESISYSIDSTNWGGTPTSPDFDVFDEEDYTTSLKTALAPGTASISTKYVVLPHLGSLVDGVIYRVFFSFVSGGNTFEGYFRVKAER
jgi:hypothetical protein